MRFERHAPVLMIASGIVLVLVAAKVYSAIHLGRLYAPSTTTRTDSAPGIRQLSDAAVRLSRLNRLLDEVAASTRGSTAARAAVRREMVAIGDDLAPYLRRTPSAGGGSVDRALRADVDRAMQLVRTELDAQEQGRRSAADLAGNGGNGKVHDALDNTLQTVLASLDLHVRQSGSIAHDALSVPVTTLRTMAALDAAATAIGMFGVLFAYRASRRQDQLADERNALLKARLTELDRFAGRVAHDILSPLGTIAAALPLLRRASDAHARPYIDRSHRALQRVQRLVEDLLTFAQSGARPDSSSRCSVDAMLAGILADCTETAAQKGIELVVEAERPMYVSCSPGVITSIVQNLVRNAIKYMGARPVRRVVVRATPVGPTGRIEVEDTGPGILPELQASIFEPFVRGLHEGVSGAGLGLATVKRLVESHGGAVGVESSPGEGSLFWVELPLARHDGDDDAVCSDAAIRP